MGVVWVVWSLRGVGVEDLAARLDGLGGVSRRGVGGGCRGWVVVWLRVVVRVVCGFRGVVWECAVLALLLRRRGVEAFLVVCFEAVVVEGAGRRRVVAGVECGGRTVAGTGVGDWYRELACYPRRQAGAGSAAAGGGVIVAVGGG